MFSHARFRVLSVFALLVTGIAVFPISASAATATDYVVVRRNGTVEVQRLTSTQAANLAADSSVRIVEPQKTLSLTDTTTEVVNGLSVPEGAQQGDIIPGRYIVTFSSKAASSVAASSVSSGAINTFSNALNGFVADLNPAELEDVQSNPNVVSIEPDSVVGIDADQSNATWGLDRIDQRMLPRNSTYSYTETGAGVSAYIIDTGIYSAHTEFTGRVQSGFTVITDGNGSEDCHGHGTHVSGTVAGTTYGVAKEAKLIPVRVLGCTGSGTMSGLISGIDWMVAHHVAGVPSVANMSVGGGFTSSVNTAIDRAVADGITVVVAAGNNNGDACLTSPASAASAITVGATTSLDARAGFSNWGTCVDIFAPGSGITSAYRGSTTAITSMSGTSMASPHVAGIAALYLQGNPSASAATVTSAVLNAATQGIVTDAGTGSPNRLAFMGSFEPAPIAAPSSPSSFVATIANGSVALKWGAPVTNGGAVVTDYVVQYSTSTSTTWTTLADAVSTALTATITDLTNGTAYKFRVAAVNSIGTGSFTTAIIATPLSGAVPSAPRSLIATPGRQSMSLSWTTPLTIGSSAVSDYLIEYSSNSGASWLRFNDGVSTVLFTTIPALIANTSYQFRVSAVNAGGSSVGSNIATATPTAFSAPSAARSVTVGAGLLSASVSWLAPTDNGGGTISAYVVDHSVDGGDTYSPGIRVASNIRYASLTNLAGGVAHIIRMRAVNEYGSSVDATAVVTPIAPTVPSTPRSATVNVGYNTASVYWMSAINNGGSAITGYAVETSTDSGSTWTRGTVLGAKVFSTTLIELVGGTEHKFRVVAINAVGAGAPSNVVTATPLALTVPTVVRAVSGFTSGSSAYLSWSTPLGFGGLTLSAYEVWQSTDNGATWAIAATTAPSVRTARVDRLVAGVSNMFRVTAKNTVGSSSPSNVVTLQIAATAVPLPPASISAAVNNTSVTLTWSDARGVDVVSDYVIEYSVTAGARWLIWADGVSTTTTATLTNLTPDVAVSMRVRARNSRGVSAASAIVTVTPRLASTVPDAPTAVTAISGDGRALLRWSAPTANGGSAITGYTATSSPGGITCSTTSGTSCIAAGLANGNEYTFTVIATNAIGNSAVSATSNAVTPTAASLPSVSASSWGLDRSDQRALPLDGQLTRTGSGAGVTVYVVDTGVLASHSEFGNRVGAGFTAVNDGVGTTDCHGHGSHVAGTIAGATYGFATEAIIIPVRVLGCNGSGTNTGVIAGINWMIDHHTAGVPAVANMSLGGGYDAGLNDAVNRAVADGITFVVAAGNESTDACTKSPASAASAITVAASAIDDSRAYYSNAGACVDIFAPGSNIASVGIRNNTDSATMSGTSMASPHVAGVVAEILGNARSLTPEQVAAVITTDATIGSITGTSSSTVNALLYQRVGATNGANMFDFDSPDVEPIPDSVDESSAKFEYVIDPDTGIPVRQPDADAPNTPSAPDTPGSPQLPSNPTSPVGVSPITQVGSPTSGPQVIVQSVVKVGKKLRVRVSAPTGAAVKLYRNGKLVAKGKKSVFLVPITSAKAPKFHAVANFGGALVVSNSVKYFSTKKR